ncbi:AAA family ATPase [Pseudodesulfovibrio methanolicus]|uniref:AAA family ATPase n=1 Tax=Pseudodesulfovibrio methanolicus TaxID=3126690 RepID=A0ABZ2IVZ3_9BACT
MRILSVTAQAGSGKTVLISQYEESGDTPFAWVTCAQQHADPRVFFEDVVTGLANACPALDGERVLRPLRQQLNTPELIDIGTRRLGDEVENIATPLVLVIDDAHVLQEHEPTLRLIRQIHDATPATLRLIVISRFALTLAEQPLFAKSSQLFIDESILALSREEIAGLYNGVLGIPASTKHIEKLHQTTQGWIAGLVLLRNTANPTQLKPSTSVRAIGRHFDELTTSLDRESFRELLLVASLSGIPALVLDRLVSSPLRAWLADMASANHFVRANGKPGQATLRLHQLFQAHLLHKAEDAIPAAERNAFLAECGNAILESGDLEVGLAYLAEAEAWSPLTEALKVHGLAMLANNRHWTLKNILDAVPEPVLDESGWLTLLLGMALLNLQGSDSRLYLTRAIELFQKQGDLAGELIATCMLINSNVIILGEFGRKAHLVRRAVELLESLEGQIPPPLIELAAQSIALGYAYYVSDTRTAAHYFDRAMAQRSGPTDITSDLWMLVSKLALLGIEGKITAVLDALSPFFAESNDAMISPTLRYALDIFQANFLLMSGDLIGYRAIRERLRTKWRDLKTDSFVSIFLTVWDLDALMADGHYDKAYRLAGDYDKEHPGIIPHMRCQILHYQMLASALLGKKEETLRVMRTALRLRAIGGGRYFVLLTQAFAGAAFSLSGKRGIAERIFDNCIKSHEKHQINQAYAIFGYRAAMLLNAGRREEARQDIKALLGEMKQYRIHHFFGWTPEIMRPVLCEAVRAGIQKDFARELANRRMLLDILDDGTPVPLLRIDCLAGMELSCDGTSIPESALAPMWRDLLRLLCESPNMALGVEAVREELWPGSPTEKTRSKLDTMLSRLRGKIGAVFGEEAKQRHLQLHGQKLYLKHCLVDLSRVRRLAKEGIELVARRKYWHAHNAFTLMRHWLGDAYEHPAAWAAGQGHRQAVMQALVAWTDLLTRSHDPRQALEVAKKALALDPINDSAQRQHYDLLIQLKRPGEAHQGLRQYRRSLEDEGFHEPEIEQIIENFFER